MSTPLLVSRKQAAEALSVSVPTLCALIQRGLLRPVRIGSRVLLSWSELQRFAESGAASEQEVEQAADVAGLGVGEELSA